MQYLQGALLALGLLLVLVAYGHGFSVGHALLGLILAVVLRFVAVLFQW